MSIEMIAQKCAKATDYVERPWGQEVQIMEYAVVFFKLSSQFHLIIINLNKNSVSLTKHRT